MNAYQKRIQLINSIMSKDPTRYGYLTTQPFSSTISSNYQTFPNSFFQTLLNQMQQFGDYHAQVMQDDPNNRVFYHQFIQQYNQCYQYLVQVLNSQQQTIQQHLGQQQQLYYNHQGNNLNLGTDQARRGEMQSNYKKLGHHHHHNRQNNNMNQTEHNSNRHHGRHYGHHGHHHGHHFKHLDVDHEHKAVYGKRKHSRKHNKSHSSSSSHSHSKKKHHSKHKQKKHHKQHKYLKQQQTQFQAKHQTDPNIGQSRKIVDQANPVVYSSQQQTRNKSKFLKEQKITQIAKVQPKPQPKPTKYSLKEIREFVQKYSIENKQYVNQQLIQQVDQINSWQQRQAHFEQKDESLISQQQLKQNKIDSDKKAIVELLTLLEKSNLNQSVEKLKATILNEHACEILIDFLAKQVARIGCQKPKGPSIYANLSQKIFQILAQSQFPPKQQESSPAKQFNKTRFRTILTSQIQSIFNKQLYSTPKFKDQHQRQNYVEDSKQKLLSILRLISELIKKRVIKRRIDRKCIQTLVLCCLQKYYNHRKKPKVFTSNYHIYFEGLIQFIFNLGKSFQNINDDSQRITQQVFDSLYTKTINLIEMKIKPDQQQFQQFDTICANDVLTLMEVIDHKVIRKSFGSISLRLRELRQVRDNSGWKKAGIKRLEIITVIEQEEKLREQVKKSLKEWQKEDNTKTVFSIVGNYSQFQYMSEYFPQLSSCCQKPQLQKRIQLFKFLLQMKPTLSNLKAAWFRTLQLLADQYDTNQCNINVEMLNRIIYEIAIAYHEPKEYLAPKNSDDELKKLIEIMRQYKVRR